MSDASAILVAIIHFLEPGGAGSKILVYKSLGNAEYTGKTINSGASSPNFFILSFKIWQDVSISSYPVRNKRISPAGSTKWICITVVKEASK